MARDTEQLQFGSYHPDHSATTYRTEGAATTNTCSRERIQGESWDSKQYNGSGFGPQDREATTGDTPTQTSQIQEGHEGLRNWRGLYMEGCQTVVSLSALFPHWFIMETGSTAIRLRTLFTRFLPEFIGFFFRKGPEKRQRKTRRGLDLFKFVRSLKLKAHFFGKEYDQKDIFTKQLKSKLGSKSTFIPPSSYPTIDTFEAMVMVDVSRHIANINKNHHGLRQNISQAERMALRSGGSLTPKDPGKRHSCPASDDPTSTPMACGSPLVSSRIVGGTNATDGAWPWQVTLPYRGSHICGGSVIGTQSILTATHCLELSLSPSDYTVRLGAYQLSLTSPHEITSRVDSINVCLPSTSDNFTEGMECWVTGWGRISSELNLPNPQTLQQVMTPFISTATCNQIYQVDSLIIPPDQICAGYAAGQKDSCQGDSGGPLGCKLHGFWYQIGIVSWGEGCAIPNRPGVYTLVPAYQSWLHTTEEKIIVDIVGTANSVPTTTATL
ncbi:hypothetical protein XELAEV_18011492mg [Xenopus laevis]|uniref:Peptidase S1 domain-containing protein n=1 Tax=Xenopus laevis TaxID=8355 RepID=A0A974DMR8_XENLA|nr:hypothetical protein XELAEV_18011492mg [Xenopus laevis]